MNLQEVVSSSPPVQLFDETDGVFSELVHPDLVSSSISHRADDLVGRVDRGNAPSVEMRSVLYGPTIYRDRDGREVSTSEVAVEIDNTSDLSVKVRWIDENGSNPPSNMWTIEPYSTWNQFVQIGHLFVLSALTSMTSEPDLFESSSEFVLGAFRPTKRLPSGSPHCLLVQGERLSNIILEVMLMDQTKLDSMCVAASSLEHEISLSPARALRTLSTLKKIVLNVAEHPSDDKYRRLRLSNPRVQSDCCRSMGAMDLIRVLGFQETEVLTTDDSATSPGEISGDRETYLVLPEPTGSKVEQLNKALEILGVLLQHADPKNKSELSMPVPWQVALRASTMGRNNWNNEGTHFLTGDERWGRVERARRLRRGGGGRPPAPGHAPSSRGRWGR
mmetsp:Transcript_52622/g.157654  ORF Transcript_52622/g.157654 Transcript_52622/m.157654 type:complete len:390 (-) Transcript_52622:585-1754(-)